MITAEVLIVCSIYFIIGALLDILGTIDIKAVQNGKALRSASVSFANTMISYIMFYYIIQSPQYLLEIIAFSLGGSVGAYFIIKKKWY